MLAILPITNHLVFLLKDKNFTKRKKKVVRIGQYGSDYWREMLYFKI